MAIVSPHDTLLKFLYGIVMDMQHSRWTMDNDMNCGNIFKFDIVEDNYRWSLAFDDSRT